MQQWLAITRQTCDVRASRTLFYYIYIYIDSSVTGVSLEKPKNNKLMKTIFFANLTLHGCVLQLKNNDILNKNWSCK